MNIPPQSSYLYFSKWTAETETILLDTMLKLKTETRWSLDVLPSLFLVTVVHEVAEKTHTLFTEAEVAERLKFMKLRYMTFKYIQKYDGVFWNMSGRCITAKDEQWATIIKRTPLAGAYYHQDEPEFSKIACVFGMDDIKKEGEKDVIVISGSTEKISEGEPSCYEVGECEEEVNSPAVVPPRSVRRVLFPEEDEVPDRKSSTDLGMVFIDLASDRQLRTRCENGRNLPKQAMRKKEQGGPSSRSAHASSCGSNSPLGGWPHSQI